MKVKEDFYINFLSKKHADAVIERLEELGVEKWGDSPLDSGGMAYIFVDSDDNTWTYERLAHEEADKILTEDLWDSSMLEIYFEKEADPANSYFDDVIAAWTESNPVIEITRKGETIRISEASFKELLVSGHLLDFLRISLC